MNGKRLFTLCDVFVFIMYFILEIKDDITSISTMQVKDTGALETYTKYGSMLK